MGVYPAVFAKNGVTLRPLEPSDAEVMYAWHKDYILDILAAWGRTKSFAAFQKKLEDMLLEPPDDLVIFGIEFDGRLVGRLELALIDFEQRRCHVGLYIGDRNVWGRGVGKTALVIAVDYAFTVLNLEKVAAEVYDFNTRSQRLMESAGFVREGVLRAHEIHNGARRDMHAYGILRDEFYQRYETLFAIPEGSLDGRCQ